MPVLERFTEAQAHFWPATLNEIRGGRKQSHWMWFIFPQLKGLGRSRTALFYGIEDQAEAEAYLAHPILGPRLREIGQALLLHTETPAETILGAVDAMKLRSSATLFEAAGGNGVFTAIIDTFFDGRRCEQTQRLLAAER